MTIWKPDTCDCRLEYDDNVNFVKSYKKCKLHIVIPDGQGLLNAILAHNQGFNKRLNWVNGKVLDSEMEQNSLEKALEKQRIRNLP